MKAEVRLSGWRVWRSRDDKGRPDKWYATRTRRISDAEASAGIYPTVGADTEAGLKHQLARQMVAEAIYESQVTG